ncbi:MAG: glycosyltransferase [Desulfobacterales bacterium]|nr:glycosyltransferase [Desulfobacterales bacterium]
MINKFKNKNFSEFNKAALRILIISGIDGAPFIYRCLNFTEELYLAGFHNISLKHVHDVVLPDDIHAADLFILNRPYKSPLMDELINLTKKYGKTLVFSTDDIVTDHKIEEYLRLKNCMRISDIKQFHEGVDWTAQVVKSSDAVIVSTDYLKSEMQDLNKKIFVLKNALSEKQIKKSEFFNKRAKNKKISDKIVIGYFSGWPNDHDYDFAIIKEKLLNLLENYQNVKLMIVGHLKVDNRFKMLGEKVQFIDFVPFYILPKYIAKININIAPLESNPHKRSKSGIKFLEAGAMHVPSICSDIEPYNSIMTHMEDGFLCSTSEDWFNYMKLLIEDRELSNKISEKAYLTVLNSHTTSVRSTDAKNIINSILDNNYIPEEKKNVVEVSGQEVLTTPEKISIPETEHKIKRSKNIRVSVVIPCYNHGNFLEGAVQSALNSSYPDFEVIVVNDGSTDNYTIDLFNKLTDKFQNDERIKFINQENLGLADARNNGIKLAEGEYILPLDADNKINPNYLAKAIDILDSNASIGVVYAYANFWGERSGVWELPDFDGRKLLVENFIDACSIIRKKVWNDCGGYDGDMGIMGYEDWDLWIGAMEKGWQFHLIKEPMFDYHVMGSSMITNCNLPENKNYLIRYICRKHIQAYKDNIEYIIANKDMTISNLIGYTNNLEKAVSEYKRIIEKFLPQNSKRRKFARFMLKTFRKISRI